MEVECTLPSRSSRWACGKIEFGSMLEGRDDKGCQYMDKEFYFCFIEQANCRIRGGVLCFPRQSPWSHTLYLRKDIRAVNNHTSEQPNIASNANTCPTFQTPPLTASNRKGDRLELRSEHATLWWRDGVCVWLPFRALMMIQQGGSSKVAPPQHQ